MKKMIMTLALGLICLVASATQQITDKVNKDGKVWEITRSPLEYLQPKMNDAFKELLGERDFINTAIQRGYVAYWYVDRGRLYLDRVEVPMKSGEFKELDNKDLKKIFRKYRRFGKIQAGWLTGNIEVGYGIGQRDTANPHIPAFAEEEYWVLKKGKIVLRATK